MKKRAAGRSAQIPASPGKRKLKLSYKEEREAAAIDGEIEALEGRIQELEQDTLRYASDFVKLNELMKEKDKAEKELEYKMERWVYLNDLKEQIAKEKGR